MRCVARRAGRKAAARTAAGAAERAAGWASTGAAAAATAVCIVQALDRLAMRRRWEAEMAWGQLHGGSRPGGGPGCQGGVQ